MTIFLVATKDANEELGKALRRQFPGDVLSRGRRYRPPPDDEAEESRKNISRSQ